MALNFVWDAVQGRYRRGGRYYSQSDVLGAVDGYLDGLTNDKSGALFNLIREGKINVRDLQLIGEREIAKAHVNAGMAAKGGRAQMSQADWGRVGGTVKNELKYWRDLMREIEDGKPLDGRLKMQLENYLRAAATTAQRVQDADLTARGFDLWKNVLDDGAHHCRATLGRPSCSSLSRKYRPIGERVLRGKRGCYWHCRCSDRYKNSVTKEIRK